MSITWILDAFYKQTACVLLQKQPEGSYRPTRYWPLSLNNAEHPYDSTHRNCSPVAWEVLLLQPSLDDHPFTVRTNHDALILVLNLMDSKGKMARWRPRLAEIEFDDVHLPGRKNRAAEALSRQITTKIYQMPIEHELPVLCIFASIPSKMETREFCICSPTTY